MNRREFLCCAGCTGMVILGGCTAPRLWEKKEADMSEDKVTVKPEDFSYCGVDCRSCDVFRATVQGDHEARIRAAKVWTKTAQEHWGMKTLDPQILDCGGCRTTEVQHKGYARCPIRLCIRQRCLASCGLCPEWRQCERLNSVFRDEPEAMKNLERIADAANKRI